MPPLHPKIYPTSPSQKPSSGGSASMPALPSPKALSVLLSLLLSGFLVAPLSNASAKERFEQLAGTMDNQQSTQDGRDAEMSSSYPSKDGVKALRIAPSKRADWDKPRLDRPRVEGNSLESKLLSAATQGNQKKLRRWIARGADVNYKEPRTGQSPIIKACIGGHLGCVRLLVDAGADIDSRTRNKNTPLIAAVKSGRTECVRYLIEKGAQINLQNIEGDTALDVARSRDKTFIAFLLSSNGGQSGDSLPPEQKED